MVLAAASRAALEPAASRPVPQPVAAVTVAREGGRRVIEWRWRSGLSSVLTAIFGIAFAVVFGFFGVAATRSGGVGLFGWLFPAFGVVILYQASQLVLNRTRVEVDSGGIRVRIRPLALRPNAEFAATDVTDVEAVMSMRRDSTAHYVDVILADGSSRHLSRAPSWEAAERIAWEIRDELRLPPPPN